jgi:predicted RNase H-like HicB family nuclease
MRYAIVIEAAQGNFSAYVPDLPGCVATGNTIDETGRQISNRRQERGSDT